MFKQTVICIETMSPLPKRIEYLDALVERFIASSSDSPSSASVVEREELSSIFLEVSFLVMSMFVRGTNKIIAMILAMV